jgi:mono/diheme cytochrome c family protein
MLRDGVVAGVIADGRGAMPAFKATLTPSQIWDLTNFVKSLHFVPTRMCSAIGNAGHFRGAGANRS